MLSGRELVWLWDAGDRGGAAAVVTPRPTQPAVPAGVRIDPIHPAVAHLVTVFGSTRNITATSPGGEQPICGFHD